MALPRRLDDAVTAFMQDVENVRAVLLSLKQQMTSTVGYDVIEETQTWLARTWNHLEDLRTRPGVVVFVRNQYGMQASDIGARAVALQSAIATALGTIRNAAPLCPQGGFVSAYTLSASQTAAEQWVYRSIAPAQTVTLRGNIDSIVAGIDALTAELLGG